MSLTWGSTETAAAIGVESPRAARSDFVVTRVPVPTLRDEWLALERRVPALLPSQSWGYLSTWWRHFRGDRSGRCWVVRDKSGEALAIVPLFVEERRFRFGTARVLVPAGHGERVRSGVVDVLVMPGRRDDVASALAPVLLRDPSWDFAEWPGVPEGGALHRIARAMARDGRVDLRPEIREAAPRLALPETFESFLSDLPDETRRRVLTLRTTVLDGLGAHWRTAGQDLDVESAMRVAEDLGCAADGDVPAPRPSVPDAVMAFRRESLRIHLRSGRAELRVLYGRARPLAAGCGLTCGDTWFAQHSGFTPAIPAVVPRRPVEPGPGGERGTAEARAPGAGLPDRASSIADRAGGSSGAVADVPGGPRRDAAGDAAEAAATPKPLTHADLVRFVTLDAMERAIDARLEAVDFAMADGDWDVSWCEGASAAVTLQIIRRGWGRRLAWYRAGLSESPGHVLKFVVGRERYEELESAWRDVRRSSRAPSD